MGAAARHLFLPFDPPGGAGGGNSVIERLSSSREKKVGARRGRGRKKEERKKKKKRSLLKTSKAKQSRAKKNAAQRPLFPNSPTPFSKNALRPPVPRSLRGGSRSHGTERWRRKKRPRMRAQCPLSSLFSLSKNVVGPPSPCGLCIPLGSHWNTFSCPFSRNFGESPPLHAPLWEGKA